MTERMDKYMQNKCQAIFLKIPDIIMDSKIQMKVHPRQTKASYTSCYQASSIASQGSWLFSPHPITPQSTVDIDQATSLNTSSPLPFVFPGVKLKCWIKITGKVYMSINSWVAKTNRYTIVPWNITQQWKGNDLLI